MAHALAGQYLGNSFIFLDCGSGAEEHAACTILSFIKPHLTIPIIVGPGGRVFFDPPGEIYEPPLPVASFVFDFIPPPPPVYPPVASFFVGPI